MPGEGVVLAVRAKNRGCLGKKVRRVEIYNNNHLIYNLFYRLRPPNFLPKRLVIEEIRAAGGKADFILSDLGDAGSARQVAKRAVELGHGHVDILINNVGIYPFGPTHEMTEEQFDRVFSLNVKVPYFLVAELAPRMAQRGTGAIVNLSTMVADYGAPGMSLYGSSKAAINLLTKTWAAEYGPSGVRVNAVSPGPTRTEGTEAMGEGLEQLAAQAPARRPATAEEIAEAIVFLATDRASFIYGARLAVDGGRTAI